MSVARSEGTAPHLVFHLPLEPARLLRARERIRDFLHAQSVSPQDVHRLVLALDEAMSNAVLHSGAAGELEVEVQVEGTDVIAAVRDRGRGFAVDAFEPDDPPEPLASHGRGLYLIAKLTDEMALRCDGGVELRAVLRDVVPAGATPRTDGDLLELQIAGNRHQQLRQRTFLEEMDEAFAALDWDYRYVHVNAASLTMSGRGRDQLLGRTLWEAFPEVRDTDVERRLRDAMELGYPSRYEFFFAPLGGWFEQRLYPTSYGVAQFTVRIDERKARDIEREELTAALQAQGHFLEGVLGSLTDAFVTVDEDWRYTFANDAAAAIGGVTPSEALGKGMWEVSPVLADDEVHALLHRAMAERVRVEYEVQEPGSGRWYRGKAYPLESGGLAIYVRDVTDGVRAEEARSEADRRYRDLMQSANSAILRWSRDGTVTFFNEHAVQLFGWSAEEALGRHVGFLLPLADEGGSDVSDLARDIVEHPERFVNNTNENVRKDGSRLWVAWTNRALADEQGKVTEVLAIGNDVTELVRAQAAMHESEQKYRSMVETTAEGVLIGRPDGRVVYANRQMAEMLGYSDEELLGISGLDLVLAEWQPRVMDNRAVLDAGKVVRGEMPLRRKDGSTLWSLFSSSALFDAAGEHIGNLTMHSDITERVHAEEALQRKAAELELALERARVAERAERALRERATEAAALAERNRLARDLHDSVTQALFAASLKAEALTLASDGASPQTAEAIREVRRLNRGALAQMRTMLLELRSDPLDAVPIDQLLRNVVEATESRASVDVRLTVRGEAQLTPTVHTAVYRITQEALNNVVRHARGAHAWVELDLEPEHVRLVIRDDGCGFDTSVHDPARLGLTSMRERAIEADADFQVVSELNGGTVVTVHWRGE